MPGPHCLPTAQLNRIAASIGRRAKRGANTYDVPPGCRELRVQVARRALEAGCALSPDDVVTTCGGQERCTSASCAATEPGDTVAIESPTYYGVLQILQMLGLKALEVPTCPADGVDLDALRTRWITPPVARDAARPGQARVQRLRAAAQLQQSARQPHARRRQAAGRRPARRARHRADRGRHLGRPRPRRTARPKACKAYDESGNVLLCGSFSKTLAPGYRVGWCAPGPVPRRASCSSRRPPRSRRRPCSR